MGFYAAAARGVGRQPATGYNDSDVGEFVSAVNVTFVGSGDAFGSGGRFQTCILVDSAAGRFLLDCGASSLIALKRQRIPPESIDTVLITHLHGDHFGGLPFFILDAQFSKRRRPLLIAGPRGLKDRVRDAMEVLFPGSSETNQGFPIDYLELPAETESALGPLKVTPLEVVHFCGSPAYALRIECDGRIIAYSGDTQWTDSLLTVADGADLFICEAYYFDKQIKFHLDYKTLMARKSGLDCKRLIVTHMSEDIIGRLDELLVEYAEDGKTISI
jgi:ribonuclease BN (tRNA processing enzyme)